MGSRPMRRKNVLNSGLFFGFLVKQAGTGRAELDLKRGRVQRLLHFEEILRIPLKIKSGFAFDSRCARCTDWFVNFDI